MLITPRNQAEEKWKACHSNLYDEGQSYHLLLEDGHRALFLSGPNKEPFIPCADTKKRWEKISRELVSFFAQTMTFRYGKETLMTVIQSTLALTVMVSQISVRSVTLI